jgi:hypothetical protein
MPVPGTEAVPYSPRGPTFTVKGAPPILVLNPLLDRLSFSPGMILKDFLKRQLIVISSASSVDAHEARLQKRLRNANQIYTSCGSLQVVA